MAERLFDYKCSECEFIDEVWAEDPSIKLDCPECKTKDSFSRAYLTFGILQTKASDSSNSWLSTKGKPRRTYGDDRAVNGF